MFKVYWELTDLSQVRDAVVATFFDIYEDVSSQLSWGWSLIAAHPHISSPPSLSPCPLQPLSHPHPVGPENADEVRKADVFMEESPSRR